MKKTLPAAVLTVAILAWLGCSKAATVLAPARHGDFAHYTFALTWQPGFCATDGGCAASQPTNVLIGLHGLWASRPQSLIKRGVSAPQWWHRGCDYFHHSDGKPPLSPATRQAIMAVMPHLRHSLLKHEYDKHVQCFEFGAERFFKVALHLRKRVADSAFGHYLKESARGHRVKRNRIVSAFLHSFGTHNRRALQLRCGMDKHGRHVLTQLWITFHSGAVKSFPRPASLMNAPIPQDNCPAVVYVPGWPPAYGP